MPTNRRKRTPKRLFRFSEQHREHLLTGRDWFGEAFGTDLDRMRSVWMEVRQHLLAEYICDHPGHRPWAWWEFDAPEQRRQVVGGTPPYSWGDSFSYGKPNCACEDPDDPTYFESQAHYLRRHKLLTDTERKALPRGAFDSSETSSYCDHDE